jgi:hypothetical protein
MPIARIFQQKGSCRGDSFHKRLLEQKRNCAVWIGGEVCGISQLTHDDIHCSLYS